MRPISNDKRNNIRQLLLENKTGAEISQRTGVSTGTISNIRSELDLPNEPSNGGRPSLISPSLGRLILRKFDSGEYQNAAGASRKLSQDGMSISAQTIRRFLWNSGYKAIHKPKVLPLTKARKQERYAFARAHLGWTVADWKKVIFSDESKINRLGSDGMQWTWTNGQELRDDQMQQMVKHGGGSLMVWGCMTWNGPGYLCNISGKVDSDFYIQILEDELLQTLEWYGLSKGDVIFQQDNASIHTAKRVQKWFNDNGIRVLQWPSHSPDLNPIEHLWALVKRRLLLYDMPPEGMLELWLRVEQIWNSISADECQKLIESMPRRIRAVYDVKGGHTKY